MSNSLMSNIIPQTNIDDPADSFRSYFPLTVPIPHILVGVLVTLSYNK